MHRSAAGLALLIAALPAAAADSVIDRYDLGRRLVEVERAWDAHPDPAARKRAVPTLKLAVPQLLANRSAEAAATLDRTRFLLRSAAEPTPAERWAASLVVHPSVRLLDPAGRPLAVLAAPAYDAGDPPAGVVLRLALTAADGAARFAAAEVTVPKLPVVISLPVNTLPEGDHLLRAEVAVGGQVLAAYVVGVSAVPRLTERVERLQAAAGATIAGTTCAATLRSLSDLLASLAAARDVPETNYPAARLLAEAEELAKAVAAGQPFYGPERPGQFWLTVATAKGTVPVRVFVPDGAKAGKPMPIVVALHGAGGSENLFFDAYGYGLVARLAKERGWMVVAPRAGWLFDGPPPAAAIVDGLAKLYPIDTKRVFVVGHSMGAGHAVAAAQQTPGRFTAIAALAGGGAIRQPAAFKDLPVFVGCGTGDFLLGAAKGLAKALENTGAKPTYKDYPGVEHIIVVQEALPDVFKFFDGKK